MTPLLNRAVRAWIPLTGLALVLVTGPSLGGESQPGEPSPASLVPEIGPVTSRPTDTPEKLRVISFNVHKGEEIVEIRASVQANERLRAGDLFLLQEIESHEAEGSSRAARLARELGLNYVYAPARPTETGGTHGLAILSRFPLREVAVLELPHFDLNFNTRRRIALAATVEVVERQLRVYNVHLDTRINTRDRLAQLRPVVEEAQAQRVDAVLIGGDFNTNPFRWVGHVLPIFRSNQAGALDEFMSKHGFEAPLAEVGSTLRRGFVRFRADAIYSRNLIIQDVGAETATKVSDHIPIWLDVTWPTGSE